MILALVPFRDVPRWQYSWYLERDGLHLWLKGGAGYRGMSCMVVVLADGQNIALGAGSYIS